MRPIHAAALLFAIAAFGCSTSDSGGDGTGGADHGESGGADHGDSGGTIARYAVGVRGDEAWIDGGDANATFAGPSLDAITISVWTRSDDTPQSGAGMVNIGPAAGGGLQLYWSTEEGDPKAALSVFNDGAVPVTARGAVTEYTQWHHIVGTFDAATGEVSVYVDGVLADTEEARAVPITVEGIIQMGRYYDGSGLRLQGLLDEVALWDRVLSPAQVESLTAAGASGDAAAITDDGLRAYWRMGEDEDGTGSTVSNRAGATDATLNGGAEFVEF